MLRFVPPCLPTKSATPPSGPLWLHEIKHDGFRVIACKDGTQVRLYSRPGNDLTKRFPLIVETAYQAVPTLCGNPGAASVQVLRNRWRGSGLWRGRPVEL
jgi:ATP-dependent DNA ligase